MRDFPTSRFLLAAAIVGMGLIPSAPAAPPGPPPPEAARDEIKPQPLPAIPDDPPSHEGAMIDYPVVVEPPDLVLVEVLEALPGRPISGERLVRPDGTISLGFYGDIHVRGLTTRQIKIKIVEHLKDYLPDEVLGLTVPDEKDNPINIPPGNTDRVMVDVTAYNSKKYFVQGDVAAPGQLPWTGGETVLDAMNYADGLIPTADSKNIRLVRPSLTGRPARIYEVDLEAIKERGEIEKNYQIFPGDRIVVGRNEVVKTTLEIDRLANTLQTVVQSIRLNTAMAREITQAANAASPTVTMTPQQREAVIEEWADFWWQVISRPEGAELDEKTFREALMRAVNPPGAVKPPEEKK